jgi:type II secretory pathway predicted ATPase ExeA
MDSKYSLDDISVAPAVETPVRPELEIITTPLVEQAWQLFSNCRITQSMGVIQGPSGTGKTFALKAILNRFTQAQLPGSLCIIPCCQASGPSSGVRGILRELGLGGAVTSNHTVAGLHYLVKLAQREITHRNIAGLLLDDADNFAVDSLGGIVSLFNHLLEAGHPITIILAGVLPEERWIAQLPSAVTRTLHVERSGAMPLKLMAAVMKKMNGPLPAVVSAHQEGDKEAGKMLRLIHGRTGGIFRRVRFFADLASEKAPGGLTLETTEAILGQMKN